MKHESTTSPQSQIGSQLSEQQQVKAIQSDQRRKHQQARFWPLYFRIRKVFFFIDYHEKGRTINSEYNISGAFEERNRKKTATNQEEKSAHSPRQCTMSQINQNDTKTTGIAFRIASRTRSILDIWPPVTTGCLQTSKECSRKEIWLLRRSDIENWGVF